MAYETDAADAQLLEDGDIATLLARYADVVVGRCVARLRGHLDAEDVAQSVMLRLLSEFERGKRYGDTPYRVVVHQVIGWTIADYFQGRPTDVPLPEDWDPQAPDAGEDVLSRYYVGDLLAPLADGDRRVMELRYLGGWEITAIATELDMTRNAVDQALHRGRERLRATLTDA